MSAGGCRSLTLKGHRASARRGPASKTCRRYERGFDAGARQPTNLQAVGSERPWRRCTLAHSWPSPAKPALSCAIAFALAESGRRICGKGNPAIAQDAGRTHPTFTVALGIAIKNLELMHKFMTELWLSPSSRPRVSTARLGSTASEENPFKLLG